MSACVVRASGDTLNGMVGVECDDRQIPAMDQLKNKSDNA